MQAARQDSLADAKSWRSTLSGAELTRLGEHCAVLEADFDGRGQMCHMISLTQNVDFIASAGSLIPALLRKTSIWRVVRSSRKSVPTGTIAYNLKLDRPMMPLEHLAVQGVPVPELLPAGHPSAANSPLTAFFADGELCKGALARNFAGNGMHLACVGGVLLFKLMTVSFKSDDGNHDFDLPEETADMT